LQGCVTGCGSVDRNVDLRLIELGRVFEELEMTLPVDREELSDSAGHDLIQDFVFHRKSSLFEMFAFKL
jgi:hypothetical protein